MNSIEAQAWLLYAQIDEATDSAAKHSARRDFHACYYQLNEAEKIAVQPVLDEILTRASRLAHELMLLAEEAERRFKNVPAATSS